jgi:hypothetical protein
MTKKSIRIIADFIPLIILIISAISLAIGQFQGEYSYQWKHILGFILLPINAYLFFYNHKIGVLSLGATIFLGLFGLIAYTSAVNISWLFWTPSEIKIPLFYGQPIFVLWLTIHLILSGRHYIGIGTKKFWQEILEKPKIEAKL